MTSFGVEEGRKELARGKISLLEQKRKKGGRGKVAGWACQEWRRRRVPAAFQSAATANHISRLADLGSVQRENAVSLPAATFGATRISLPPSLASARLAPFSACTCFCAVHSENASHTRRRRRRNDCVLSDITYYPREILRIMRSAALTMLQRNFDCRGRINICFRHIGILYGGLHFTCTQYSLKVLHVELA